MHNKGNNLTNEELYNLFRNIPKTDRMPSRAKQITDIFNSLDINRRKSYLDYLRSLPNAEQKIRIFTNTIRKQAVIDFWFHEREAIINGISTYDWSPRQIECIMNLFNLYVITWLCIMIRCSLISICFIGNHNFPTCNLFIKTSCTTKKNVFFSFYL